MADRFVIFDGVPFSRHDYTNRVQIKTNTGAQWLTVPVEHGSALLCDTKIVDGPWRRKHLRTIELAYQKAEHFERYFPALRGILSQQWTRLVDLDETLLRWLMNELGIKIPVERASGYTFGGEKSALVLDMCQQLGATKYIFGHHGKDYADVEAFRLAGVEPIFQQYVHPVYKQLHGEFIPGLSILDLLFNHGPDSLEILKGA